MLTAVSCAVRWMTRCSSSSFSLVLEGSAKTPRMEIGALVIGNAARPKQVKHRRYELVGWEFKPDKRGIRQKRAILRELPSE